MIITSKTCDIINSWVFVIYVYIQVSIQILLYK